MHDDVKETLLERPLPHSIESEQAILGAIILNPSLILSARALIKPEDFFIRAHQFIFRSMLDLSERVEEMTIVQLGEELRCQGYLEQTGGLAYISELTYGLPHFPNIAYFAKVIRGKSLLRQLIKTIYRTMSEAFEEDEEPEVILGHAEQAIRALYKNEQFEELKRIQNTIGPKSKRLRDKIFISYSHRDKPWLIKLQTVLKPLLRKGEMSIWDDTMIQVGAKWREEIRNALDSARIAVLLGCVDVKKLNCSTR